eukprot:1161203-Pelagomonas_calceolata.AAC.4
MQAAGQTGEAPRFTYSSTRPREELRKRKAPAYECSSEEDAQDASKVKRFVDSWDSWDDWEGVHSGNCDTRETDFWGATGTVGRGCTLATVASGRRTPGVQLGQLGEAALRHKRQREGTKIMTIARLQPEELSEEVRHVVLVSCIDALEFGRRQGSSIASIMLRSHDRSPHAARGVDPRNETCCVRVSALITGGE